MKDKESTFFKNVAYISLGSNIKDRFTHLKNAVEALQDDDEITVVETSSIYETDPVGFVDQDLFLNAVVKITTSLSPLSLLYRLQKMEHLGGRERSVRWGPRTIDLDILLFNDENINLDHLQIPHPRLLERGFVLIPLSEIEPTYKFLNGKSIVQYIKELTNKEGVHKWRNSFGEDASEHFES